MSSKPRWIEAGDNPFGVRIFDCRPMTRMATSTTNDPNIAMQFSKLRDDNGKGRRGKTPDNAVAVAAHLQYSKTRNLANGPLYRARDMDEKWDVDFYKDQIYFTRSWTGDLNLRVDIVRLSTGFAVSGILSLPNAGLLKMSVPNTDFLIKTYLFGVETPHQMPDEFPDDESNVLTYSFSQFGLAASFATYADITQIKI